LRQLHSNDAGSSQELQKAVAATDKPTSLDWTSPSQSISDRNDKVRGSDRK